MGDLFLSQLLLPSSFIELLDLAEQGLGILDAEVLNGPIGWGTFHQTSAHLLLFDFLLFATKLACILDQKFADLLNKCLADSLSHAVSFS